MLHPAGAIFSRPTSLRRSDDQLRLVCFGCALQQLYKNKKATTRSLFVIIVGMEGKNNSK
jgi:hypothetical protein